MNFTFRSGSNDFTAFASPQLRIRGAMLDGIRSFDWVPRLVRQRVRKRSVIREQMIVELGREPSGEELRDRLDLPAGDFEKLMGDSEVNVLSLSRKLFETNAGKDVERIDLLAVENSEPELDARDSFLRLIRGLHGMRRRVVILRYWVNKTMKETGMELGISEARVSQVHADAIEQLQESASSESPAASAAVIDDLPPATPFPQFVRKGESVDATASATPQASNRQPPKSGKRRCRKFSYACDRYPGEEFSTKEAAKLAGVTPSAILWAVDRDKAVGKNMLKFVRVTRKIDASPVSSRLASKPNTAGSAATGSSLRDRLEAKMNAEIDSVRARYAAAVLKLDEIEAMANVA